MRLSVPLVTEQELNNLAERLGRCLIDNGLKLVSAESCTGGWVAKIITDVPGSSAWFIGSLVCYSNELKQRFLGVKVDTLIEFGAVSSDTVHEMSDGLFAYTDADVAVSVSGIAGPGGGSVDKPVGLVWLSWGRRGKPLLTQSFNFGGDREAIRKQAIKQALTCLLALLACD
ncbi:MAG: damage-inducible protein CinA [Gammaproteobacteria bacterium]|nr:MAG: damage-inducible protein CinA [Gammaproteobacteria bacterium]